VVREVNLLSSKRKIYLFKLIQMGSTGTGSLTDYSKRRPKNEESKTGGSSGKDECGKAISSALEDVSRCFYFIDKGKVPGAGTVVNVFFNGVRVSLETSKGEEIGYLPTKYNYLKLCLDAGFKYKGEVRISSMKPVPSITVDVTPV
jgi:hypothetical protein